MRANSDNSFKATTLVELLQWRAQHQESEQIYTFLVEEEPKSHSLNYGELDRSARSIGAMLQGIVQPGDRAILLYPPGLEYIAAFFGCLYAGIVAVPAYPPIPGRLDRTLLRLYSIVQDAQPKLILTTSAYLTAVEALISQNMGPSHVHCLATNADDIDLSSTWREPILHGTALAFLQYTSGSTGSPKGVMLTHENLLHNSKLIYQSFGHSPESRGVIWLPPYHDMGLIGGIIQPLYAGFPVTLMSPLAFLQRPMRWLQAISETRATTSGGPNFAYDLCVRKITSEQCTDIDLSNWKVAFCGAEPIRHSTLENFNTNFAPYGFQRKALFPCYGLAEATLIVSGNRKTDTLNVQTIERTALQQNRIATAPKGSSDALTLVGCGQTMPDQTIIIVHPETRELCPPNTVGEIWISGPSVAQGYWDQLENTVQTFQARLVNQEGPSFLRTGDLGFLEGENLFVTGRLKDLIIIRGSNYYPEDIELLVEQSHPAFRPGFSAAFQIDTAGEEQLVVAQELDRRAQEIDVNVLAAVVRQALAEAYNIQAHVVVFLKAGTIPKTSSGKIQRQACKRAFLEDTLEVVGSSSLGDILPQDQSNQQNNPSDLTREKLLTLTPSERQSCVQVYLKELIARILRVEVSHIHIHQSLMALGVDSLAAVDLKNDIDRDIGVSLPLVRFLEGPSITDLGDDILSAMTTASSDSTQVILEPVQNTSSEYSLSYNQQALWFMYQLAPGSITNILAFAARIRAELDVVALGRALYRIVARHSLLRATFTTRQGLIVQKVHENIYDYFTIEEAFTWDEAELDQQLLSQAQRPFNLESGPLLRAHLYKRAINEHILVVAVPHLIADLRSMEILLHELSVLYMAEKQGASVSLPHIPLQYTDYIQWEGAILGSPTGSIWAAYWQQALIGASQVLKLRTDRPRPPVQTYISSAEIFELSRSCTEGLKALAAAQNVTLYIILLAAFEMLLYRYTDQEDFIIGSPVDGRSRSELANIVAPLAKPVALRADLSENPEFFTLLERVRNIVLSALEHQDYPLSLIIEHLQPMRSPSHHPLFQVMFNFLASRLSDIPNSNAYALGVPGNPMYFGDLPLESISINQAVDQFDLTLIMSEIDGKLTGSFQYNTDLFNATSITRMVEHFRNILEKITTDPEQRVDTLLQNIPKQKLSIVIASTFTSEPLEDSLSFWMSQLDIASTIRFAPFNQVFQQLLELKSLFNTNTEGVNVILVRIEDFVPRGKDLEIEAYQDIERNLQQLLDTLQSALDRNFGTYLLGLCPLSKNPAEISETNAFFHRMEMMLHERVDQMNGAYFLSLSKMAEKYQVKDWYDPFTDELAGIPYTSEFFAVIGSSIARTIYALFNDSYKVIAVDCDQTLWEGICGEDGPSGIRITTAHHALQQFLVDQHNKGVLLCFCTKNNYIDIAETFQLHPEMPLQLEHFASSKINWHPKSENIKALAIELDLSLDSFIFLDDDPLECSEVQAQCPEVLVLQLPENCEEYPTFLDHIWPFDRLKVTAEARSRALLYAQNQERKTLELASTSLEQFISELQVSVTFTPVESSQLARAAELTRRTNQFNTTTIRLTENDLLKTISTKEVECWVVQVTDRFGDYGLVGVVLFQIIESSLVVNVLLLSCRVLGRRVEHSLLESLLRLAEERNCSEVKVIYQQTPRNAPVLEFLQGTDGLPIQLRGDVVGFRFLIGEGGAAKQPSVLLHGDENGEVSNQKDRAASLMVSADTDTNPLSPSSSDITASSYLNFFGKTRLLVQVSAQFRTADQILSAIRFQKRARPELAVAFTAPRTVVEEVLAATWAELLSLEQVGVHDNFFELGGHSLLAIQIISRLHDVFQIETPLLTLFFETPTVSGVAQAITASHSSQASNELIAQTLKDLDQLSDEEVENMLHRMSTDGDEA